MMPTSLAARVGVVEMRQSGRFEPANIRSVRISSQKARLLGVSSSSEGE